MRDACGWILKYVLFFSNLAIWIGGMTAIGLATWVLVGNTSIAHFLGTNLLSGAVYILLATGVVVALVALFGCIGAIKEIKFILVIYLIILFIIFIVMLAGGILGYVFIDMVEYTMETEMYSSLKQYGNDKEVTNGWDNIQTMFRCCGVHNQNDWLKVRNIPDSCYRKRSPQAVDSSDHYTIGCLNTTVKFIQDHAEILGGAGIGIACLMLLGMLFSWGLYMIIE
ncbi:UNVERIFIED_CONTAM: hypothetical protein PYX00_003689 [Menopon gallinae]|uniref:Tetraspanin n=1 Tax=Menopon gallinae TaxID=328185 RepID=A0AAW2I203_9NEOP